MSAAFRVAFNDSLDDVKRFFGFFGSREFGGVVARTARGNRGAGGLACVGTVGLGCGWGALLMADGASNIQ